MAVTCRSILSMEGLAQNIRLLAGTGSLSNTVRWTHVLESIDAARFLQGNELTFLTGVSLGGDTARLVRAVELLSERRAAGLVINTGKFILSVPREVVDRAEALGLPLFELPWEVRLVDVTKRIGEAILKSDMEEESASYLLERALFSEEADCADIVRSAEFYGRAASGPLCVAVAEIANPARRLRDAEGGVGFLRFQQRARRLVEHALEPELRRCLCMWKADSLILALPQESGGQAERIGGRLREEAERLMPELAVHIGFGGPCEDAGRLKKSYSEAHLAVRLIGEEPGFACMAYKDAGIYKFLNKIGDRDVMADFFEETLGPLLRYDEKNGTGFFKTLQVYLEEGGNTLRTAGRLYIHRNTLQYRLGRVEEILRHSLKDPEERINLQIAFKVRKFLRLQGAPLRRAGPVNK